ncbi:MAG: citrate (Si)-synthase [candidate division WOR-3 bacterium]
MKLKEVLREKIEIRRKEIKEIREKYGNKVVSQVTVDQIFRGMRGVKCMIWEGSYVDPQKGIFYRGYTIPELREKLPKVKDEPLPEGLFYLLLTGDIPTMEEVKEIQKELNKRMNVPDYVFKMLKAMPKTSHPMALFSMGVLALRDFSKFAKLYDAGKLAKEEYWEMTLEDSLDLLAKIPVIAAFIYRRLYKDSKHKEPDKKLDWAANLAHMMGYDNEEVYELMRLYLFLHADHEGGNVSAHTGHLVASALSDVYYSFSAAMNGLAGPLHGRANMDTMAWLLQLKKKYKGKITEKEVEEFTKETLEKGEVIPGFGHAVLRVVDPRYIAFRDFALKYMPDDPIFKIVDLVYKVVPDILKATGKVADPYPNVDAHSGCVLYHYGIKEFPFYTVFFGISRALGILAQLVWDRALGFAIERPKSITLEWLKENIEKI